IRDFHVTGVQTCALPICDEANLAYNESISVELCGDLQIKEFKQAVKEVVLRHEALRSTFSADGESLFTYRSFPVAFELEDISIRSEERRVGTECRSR